MTQQQHVFPRPVCYGLGLATLFALAAVLLVGCSDVPAKDALGQAPTAPEPSQAGQPPRQRSGEDLIASPASPFAVTFKWENPVRHEQGFLVWRQGNDVRRWDIVDTKDGEVVGGSITFDSAFSTSVTLSNSSLGCLWVTGPSAPITRNAPPGQAFASCSGGGNVIFKPIDDVLLADVGSRLEDRAISGRTASCYLLDDWRFTAATLCVDASQGIPLLITTDYNPDYGDSRFSQSMEAISVSTAEQDVPVPLGLEPDAANPSYEGMAAISDLGLPELPELEQ